MSDLLRDPIKAPVESARGDHLLGLDAARVAAELTARLTEWDGLLHRHPQQARQISRSSWPGASSSIPSRTPAARAM